MKKLFKRLMSVVTTPAHDSQSTQPPATDAAPVTEQYADDAPISTSAEDRFSRWPFTERIANVIANRTDPASIVIGIYGPWGDGKTSVLNMMREALARNDNVICIQFNPWHFENDQRLIRAFFDTLSDGLGKTLATKGERIGEALQKYGDLLGLAGVGGVAELGEKLSSVELDKLKDRLSSLLVASGILLVKQTNRLRWKRGRRRSTP